MNKRLLIYILLIILMTTPIQSYGLFSDTQGHWADDHIFWATFDYPVFIGYPDGTFRPENTITRAEYLTMINKLLDLANDPYPQRTGSSIAYRDLDASHWAYSHILSVHQSIEGINHNSIGMNDLFSPPLFEPDKRISRYEAALLSYAILPPAIDVVQSESNQLWDLDELDSNTQLIRELTIRGIIRGFPDGSFRPDSSITRAEASALAKKIFDELSYLKEDYLSPAALHESEIVGYPIFEKAVAKTNISQESHRQFIDAVTSLEYISIIGFIPYEERNLYDSYPIQTLWKLKNNDYANQLGINYYLIKYDEDLTVLEKQKLADEATRYYLSLTEADIDGMADFFEKTHNLSTPELFREAAEEYIREINNEREILRAADLLGEHYRQQQRWELADKTYQRVLEKTKDAEIIGKVIQNRIYLALQHQSIEETLTLLEELRNLSRELITTSAEQEAINDKIKAIQKQLLIR
ncbi:MAG: S-layer homology domain-containing protein [Tindallia sp. MSAO_Bac2]|nr:MAG: S-layer homology domain-containing protein [Tindallia sp. MSAO_Bac2]